MPGLNVKKIPSLAKKAQSEKTGFRLRAREFLRPEEKTKLQQSLTILSSCPNKRNRPQDRRLPPPASTGVYTICFSECQCLFVDRRTQAPFQYPTAFFNIQQRQAAPFFAAKQRATLKNKKQIKTRLCRPSGCAREKLIFFKWQGARGKCGAGTAAQRQGAFFSCNAARW